MADQPKESRTGWLKQGYNDAGDVDRHMAGFVPLNKARTHVLLIQQNGNPSWILPTDIRKLDKKDVKEEGVKAARRAAWNTAGIICEIFNDLGSRKNQVGTQVLQGSLSVEYRYYEAIVTAEEADWPMNHKCTRAWVTYPEAIAMMENDIMLQYLSRSRIIKDSAVPHGQITLRRNEAEEIPAQEDMGGPSNTQSLKRGLPNSFWDASSTTARSPSPKFHPLSHTANLSPQMLRSALIVGNRQQIEQLLVDHFSIVASEEFAWLHELRQYDYTTREMAVLLLPREDAPWIYGEYWTTTQMTDIANVHQRFCVHSTGQAIGDQPETSSNSTYKNQMDSWFSLKTYKSLQCMEQLCGIAGIPPLRGHSYIGRASFKAGTDGLTASISFGIQGLDRGTGILQAFQNLSGAIRVAQDTGMCCNSFTVLRLKHNRTGSDILELQKIKFRDIIRLQGLVSSLHHSHFMDKDIMQAIADTNDPFLCDPSLSISSVDIDETLNYCSLVAQFLSLGFSSYINAHVGPIDLSFLDSSLEVIHICGTGSSPEMTASLYQLSCMDAMLRQPVLAFEEAREHQPEKQKTYNLLASPEDLVDTWGPGQFITSDSPTNGRGLVLSCVIIGGGMLKATAKDNISLLHWSNDIYSPQGILHGHFNSMDKRLIGAGLAGFNEDCQTNHIERWSSFMGSLQNLSTTAPHWQSTEFQAGAGFAGKSELGSGRLSFNKTWTWHAGNSWKRQYLSLIADELPFSELDRPWGLQVSACTGVARRVPLRVILSDTIQTFAENLALPPGWLTLLQGGIIGALAEGGQILKQWYIDLHDLSDGDSLQILTKRLIRYILLVLRDTGLDRDNKNLLVACPQDHGKHKPISMCMPIPCTKGGFWAKILQDSDNCATFACMTSFCLETPDDKCQHTQSWSCPSLYTAVQESRTLDEGIELEPHPWALEANRLYWIGMPKAGLQAKAVKTAESPFLTLHISESRIPLEIRKRLERMGRPLGQKLSNLRERQIEGWPAEDVLIRSL